MTSSGAAAGLEPAFRRHVGRLRLRRGMGCAPCLHTAGHRVRPDRVAGGAGVLCFLLRLALPGTSYLIYAAIGGFEGALALAVFYRALSMGAMGLTAALTGLMTALIPVIFELFHSGWPRNDHAGRPRCWPVCNLVDLSFAGNRRRRYLSPRVAARCERGHRVRCPVDPL